MGQLADKAHRVHQEKLAAVRQRDPAGDRVQGGEQLVFRVHPRAGDGIQDRGFAGVGVAHQRHNGDGVLFPALAAKLALLLQGVQFLLQPVDLLPDAAAVDFQLAFAGAAGADAAA